MDGNGRWAQRRHLPRIEGHRQGAQSVREVVRAARQLELPALTLYAFSSQNWQRPPDEVKALMELLRDYLIEERPEIMDNGIRLTAIGRLERLPSLVREPLDELVRDSAGNRDMILCLALSYGGREAIIDAARAALQAGIPADRLDEETVSRFLPTSDLPPLDLVIRTSGEQRISNFLLWQTAYAEFSFTDTLWPDFAKSDLEKAVQDFHGRDRRYGASVGSR